MHTFLKNQQLSRRLISLWLKRARYLYHRMRSLWPVWFFLLNRNGRRAWARLRPHDSPSASALARDLSRDGIAVTHIDKLFEGHSPFPGLESMALRLLAERRDENLPIGDNPTLQSKEKHYDKTFLRDLWEGGRRYPRFDLANPFIRLALEEQILLVAGEYLGVAPKLNDFTLQLTLIVSKGKSEIYSQRWHRDPEDKRRVKVFLYLTDVSDIGAGPFMYVRGSQYGGKWRNLFPQVPPVGRYPDPGAVERAVPEQDIAVATGPAGTLIFCDTSGLHRGGYSTSKERIMETIVYVTDASIYAPRFPKSAIVPNEHSLSRLARYALE